MNSRLAITGVLLGAAFLGACSAPAAQAPPQVASVRTGDVAQPSSSGPVTPPPPERPRSRIDMTEDEQKALREPYLKCMSEHGVDVMRTRAGEAPKPDQAKLDAAVQACDPLLPLPPWENDASNPAAFDFNRRVVTCLRAKGVRYVEVSRNTDDGIVGPSFGGEQNDQESITRGLELTPQCQREVANGGYK